MTAVNIHDMAQTWNDAATVFDAIKMNVTKTAAAAGSLLLNLQVGGVAEFQVAETGQVLAGMTASNSPTYSFVGDPDTGWGYRQANTLAAVCSGSEILRIQSGRVDALTSDMGPSVGGALVLGNAGTYDVFLERDSANTLALRNGANAQAFNLYNIFSDASNYERGFFRFVSNVMEIGTEAAGTGASRDVQISADTGQYVIFGRPNFSTFASAYLKMGQTSLSNDNAFRVRSSTQFGWTNSASSANLTIDTGLVRQSAGVVRVTTGSTGTGELIFIVPTTDPGIPGALWNNSGTPAISV